MRIAMIGTGIASNVAAYQLRDKHDITVYKAADYVGGHGIIMEMRASFGLCEAS